MKTINTLTLAILLFAWQACTSGLPEDDHSGRDHEAEEKEQLDVHMVEKQMEVMNIRLGTFQNLNLSTTVKSNGRLELPPQNKASVSSLLEGRVSKIYVLEGDHVQKGQALANVEHPAYIDVQQQYLEAKSELEFAQRDYTRKQDLATDSVSSAKSLQQAEAAYRSLKAQVNGLESKLVMLGTDLNALEVGNFSRAMTIRAPIRGYVKSIDVNMGMSIAANQSLFEIVDNEHIHIDLRVYESDINKIEKEQRVMFSLTSNPDSVFQGSVFAVGRAFEDDPKAMIVHAEIDNAAGDLLPGMYVDARIITDNKSVMALPNDAIVSDGGLDYIFVLKPQETHTHAEGEEHDHDNEFVFRKIEVNTGAKDIGFTEVVPVYNLPENVQIVTSGAFYLLAEMKKGEGGHGHHH